MSIAQPTFDNVWLMFQETERLMKDLFATSQKEIDRRFQETDRRFQETDRRFQETDRRFQETERLMKNSQKETDLKFQETDRKFQETDRKFQDTDRKFQETDRKFQDTDRKFQETDRKFQDTDRKFQDTDRKFQETDRKFKELGKQIGGLGEKFGSFTEGLALPSMERILRQRFGMEVISPSVRVSKGGEHLEIDVLAYANSSINQVYVVEVKSHPREESIVQIKNLLERFRDYFPEHKNKSVYGILAAVDISLALRERTLREGVYVARIHDNVFEMDTPDDFQARAY